MVSAQNTHRFKARPFSRRTCVSHGWALDSLWFESKHILLSHWVMRYWRGYLSAARCKWFAYSPADATATPSSLASLKSRPV